MAKRARRDKRWAAYQAVFDSIEDADDATKLRGIPAIDGSHRNGKRRRATSVLRQAPKVTTFAYRFDVHTTEGEVVAVDVNMVVMKPE